MPPPRFLRHPLRPTVARHCLLSCAALSSLPLLAASQAEPVVMEELLNLPGGTEVDTMIVSGNGQVIAGETHDAGSQLFYGNVQKGFVPMGAPFSSGSFAYGLSRDGSVIVGTARGLEGNASPRAFRWTAASGFTNLGTLGGSRSEAYDVSDDGSVVVGTANNAADTPRAFRWVAGTLHDLGSLAQHSKAWAYGVSGNGKVVVGQSYEDNDYRAVLWDANGAILDLGGSNLSWARGTNYDGSVVVGRDNYQAFRWTAATGMQSLGTLGGSRSDAKAVSADGSVVVGNSQQANGNNLAFRWTAATGMVSLGTLKGQPRSYANSVSDDGNTIVGTSGRAFIWSQTDRAMQDLQYLQLSQITSAATLGQLTAAQNRRLRDLNQQHCLPTDAQQYCLSSGLSTYRSEATSRGNQVLGQASGGLRLNEQFAAGASVNLGQAALHSANAEQTHAYGLALWGSYQQQPNAQGWVGSASVGMGHSHNRFERGAGLTDVQRAQARTAMRSNGVRLAVGYGVQMGKSRVTPEVALSHTRTTSDGFTERYVAFPLTVNATSSDETYATVGIRSETPLTPKTTLHLGAAVDALLNDNTDAIEGSSAVPGLNRFQLPSHLDKRELLPMANAGISYAVSAHASVSGQVQVSAATHTEERAMYGLEVQYRYAF